jgi:hypothetical protein
MVQETRKSNRNLTIALAVGALLFALVVVGAVLFFVLGKGGSGEGAAAAESAKMMPADTMMYASFNPRLDQAKNYEVIQKAWGDNPVIQKGLEELLASMDMGGMSWKNDIQPWLGDEIAFGLGPDFFMALGGAVDNTFAQIEQGLSGEAVTPSAPEMAEVPQFYAAIATQDQAASDKFLAKLRAEAEKDGAVFQETDYKGVQVVYQESELAYATVGDYVVLAAGGLEAMQAVIDAHEGVNLAESQAYKDVLAKLPADQVMYGFMDMGSYMEAMLEMAGPAMVEIPKELFDPDMLKAFKGAGFSLGFEPNGVRVDFAVTYDKAAIPEDMLNTRTSPNKTAGRLPSGTLLYISGIGLGDGVQMVLDAVKAMPDAPPDLDESLQMLTAFLGVSVDELVEMLSGEFALAVTHEPAGLGGDPSVPVGVSVLLEAKDEEKFEKLINSVATLAAMGGGLQLGEETINDVAIKTIPNPENGEMIAGMGVGQGYFAVGTSQVLLEAAFGGGAKLADDAIYKAAIAPLPGKNSGIFFLNLGGLFDIIGEAMSPWERESFEEARPILEPIKAISAAAEPYNKDKNSASGTLFILIESE